MGRSIQQQDQIVSTCFTSNIIFLVSTLMSLIVIALS